MSNYPFIDRESFQKLLASAFVIQQSRMNRQSRAAISEVRRLIKSGALDVDEAMYLIDRMQKLANTPVTVGPLSGAQPCLLGIEEYTQGLGAVPPPLTSVLVAHGAEDVSADATLDPALGDIAEQTHFITLNGTVDPSTLPARDDLSSATDITEASFTASRFPTLEVKTTQSRSHDSWTPWLAILAIALTLLLGWMLGQVIVLGTAPPEGLPLRANVGRGTAPRQPELVKQTNTSPLAPTATKSASHEAPSDSSPSQH